MCITSPAPLKMPERLGLGLPTVQNMFQVMRQFPSTEEPPLCPPIPAPVPFEVCAKPEGSKEEAGPASFPSIPRVGRRSLVDFHFRSVHLLGEVFHSVLKKAGVETRTQKGIAEGKSPFLKIPRKHVPYKYMTSVINRLVPFRIRSNCLALLGTTDTSKQKALYSATWSSACGYLFPFFFLFWFLNMKPYKGGEKKSFLPLIG